MPGDQSDKPHVPDGRPHEGVPLGPMPTSSNDRGSRTGRRRSRTISRKPPTAGPGTVDRSADERLRTPARGEEHPARADEQRHERKERVLTQGTASIVRSISDAVVAKDGEPFFLCPPDGQVPCSDGHGYGLYHHDCRFLGGYELAIAESRPSSLAATAAAGTKLVLELTNAEIRTGNDRLIRKEQLGITWTRQVDRSLPGLRETIEIRNYGRGAVSFPLDLRFASAFEDVFQIRGLLSQHVGREHAPGWDGERLTFRYDGADGIVRSLVLTFDPKPERHMDAGCGFDVRITGRGATTISVTAMVGEEAVAGAAPIERRESPSESAEKGHAADQRNRTADQWIGGGAWDLSLRTSSLTMSGALSRSLDDLQILRSRLDGHRYYEAGIPWFATLFGRDSLIAALQSIAFDASMAADTLRLLAGRQGRKVEEWRDEEPGKILHELRIGELARLGEIPQTPYFGTVDATPLFLILVAEHARWTGSLDLFHELRPSIDAALRWLDAYADTDGDGFIDYQSHTEHGLANQGWKDSGDAIVMADGSIAKPPIALVEVQGYAFKAWRSIGDLLERDGDVDAARALRDRAEHLRAAFEERFWSDRLGTYILALGDGSPCEVVASNAGQVLWAGIASADRARRVARRLLQDDMFNGWGVRTLATSADAFQPIGYHLGTVWPHDNSLIAAGMRDFGHADEAERILVALVEASLHFPHQRLPECFAGYDRAEYGVPVRYPVACHPQAWAAGSIPFLVISCLGLRPDGFGNRLEVVEPRLPAFVDSLELRGLRVGSGRAHLRFERVDGRTDLEVIAADGGLDVDVRRAEAGAKR
jgi:glycogen debranching enzyme